MRPNILFILTDQQRHDTLGCAGNRQIQTPHLDALAQDGVFFPNAYCPFPVCTPSRYSMLSGLYVHQHGGWSNKCTLPPHLPTFPKLLRQSGYKTHAIGKMHFTPTYLDTGYDRLELSEQDGDGRLDDDYHRDLKAHDLADLLDIQDQRAEFRARAPQDYWDTFGAQVSDLPEEWHSTTWIGDRALRAVDEWDESGGNLLTTSFIKPHHPFDPPARWAEMYDPDDIELLPGWTPEVSQRDAAYKGYFPHEKLTEAGVRRATAFYYATISQIDHHVGRLVARLRERGLYDDTLIVFTSDHGEYLGFHHLLLKSGPMYDPLLRVPLLLKLPNRRDAGTTRPVLCSNVDLAPTLLKACDVEPSPLMTGLDLSDPQAERPMLFFSGIGHRFAARSRTHKLMLGQRPEQNSFFDLQRDPLETNDLFHDPASQPLIAQYRQAIGDWLMFEAPTPILLDENAPHIEAPNVPPGREHRDAMRDYFEGQYALNTQGDL